MNVPASSVAAQVTVRCSSALRGTLQELAPAFEAASAAITANSTSFHAAQLFVRYLTSPVAAEIMRRKGFTDVPYSSAQENALRGTAPRQFKWKTYPALPAGAALAVLLGNPQQKGLYVERVRVPSGVKVPPHRHPEDRVYTVISGTWFIGIGEKFDPGKLEEFPKGSVVFLPANTPHFHWAKAGQYVVQISGIGPTDVHYVDPDNDPRLNGASGKTGRH
jgi:quercetin dioxygenase-like cupin family protein